MGLLTWIVSIACGVGAGLYLLAKRYPWLRYDWQYIRILGGSLLTYSKYTRQGLHLIDVFEQQVKRVPTKTFIIFQGQKFSYEFIDKEVNKVAHLAGKLGLKKGDTACVMMYNEPAFIYVYLGLVKVGVRPAFINTNLRAKGLLHCISVADGKVLIVGCEEELVGAVRDIQQDLTPQGVNIYVSGKSSDEVSEGFRSLDSLLSTVPDDPIPRSRRAGIGLHDPISYIFTSGTTGLPKAATVSHAKALKANGIFQCANCNSNDVVYTPLPLYHSAANLIALGSTIHMGGSLVLRSKFSATHYWDDCRKYNVTITQYIGELCRYLLARPPSPDDGKHTVRACIGNGLRRDIWEEFQTRFKIPLIVEFYAATEGNAGLINFFNKTGSCGRASPLLQKLYPTIFIKYDYETAQPVRGENGFCRPAKPGEQGLMLSRIRRNMEYEGYKGNAKLTQDKVVTNVFQQGDSYFNTGDLFILDKDYFVYFSDRIGDTFRWKGENVSTIEVSNLISDIPWIEDTNVYGVEISGNDGRAGMAALLPVEGEEVTDSRLQEVYRKCEEFLPTYARPRFLRVQRALELTGTLKHRKVELVKEGFDPIKCQGEPLYCMDAGKKTYVPLDSTMYQHIIEGKIRL